MFVQGNEYVAWRGGEFCKTVGSAYVGSNPTPATTRENGPLAAETRPGGPFPSCHAVYQDVSLRVDAWQCPRTYSGQRPGETSGAYNRSLCRSAPVLSRYPGAGLPRIPVDPVLRRPGRARRRAGHVRTPGPGRGCRIGPRHLIEAPRRGMTACVAATGMEDQHGVVASGAVPGSGRRDEPQRHVARVPGVPSQGH